MKRKNRRTRRITRVLIRASKINSKEQEVENKRMRCLGQIEQKKLKKIIKNNNQNLKKKVSNWLSSAEQ